MNPQNKPSPERILNDPLGHSVENVLREVLQPVTPRHEFIDHLKGRLEENILPIQKKKTISFYTLIEITLRTIGLLVITILSVRALMVVITTWRLIRVSNMR